ncbi:pseudouridine synthase [Candidatus Bandiella euplotis]|nr:pseudouridine synthase [Candidatus Bandiella woodruffii]
MSLIRISKALSACGASSRREAEKLIAHGLVKVNGVTINTPVFFVKDEDEISVAGKVLSKNINVKLWKYFKPKGVITSHKDPLKRTTLFEILPSSIGRVISVGRLDYNTEGLILLTNSGNLARTLELPSTKIERVYLCKAHGKMPTKMPEALAAGVTIDSIKYAPIFIEITKQHNTKAWYKVTLSEGKNREIRRVFERFDLQVTRLIRTSYGKFSIGSMKERDLIEIDNQEFNEYTSCKLNL